jgi:putative oxidoreductase
MGLFTTSRHDKHSRSRDLGVLLVRLTTGGLLAGHGAQKLFGSFGGYGLEGTAGWLDSMGFKPGKQWAMAAGASEFGGGMLTALGLLHPIGPLSSIGAMAVATRTAHRGKPIWVTEGGAELPVTNISVAVALSLVGAGRYSLDHMMGIRIPNGVALATGAAVALGVMAAEQQYTAALASAPPPETPTEDQG